MESHGFEAAAGSWQGKADRLDGVWTLRFGLFGCLDIETHGGVLHIHGDRLTGGDSNFVYLGSYVLTGTELVGWLEVIRHGADPSFLSVFGTIEPSYKLRFTAEAIAADHFEGRFQRAGHPDVRLVMRKLAQQVALV